MTVQPPGYLLIRDELDMMVRFTDLNATDGASIINIEFANYLCLLIYEQARFLNLDLQSRSGEIDHRSWLRRGRMLSKDLGDDQSVTKHLRQFDQFVEAQRTAWEETHVGRLLGRMFRRLQPDMGFSFLGSAFLANTTSLSLISAFPSQIAVDLPAEQDTGEKLMEFGKFIGISVVEIAQSMGMVSRVFVKDRSIEVPKISHIDVRSQSVSRHMEETMPGLDGGVGFLLLGILTRLRCRSFLAEVLRDNDTNLAIMKLKFLSVWSTGDLLRKLVRWSAHSGNKGLPPHISRRFSSVLNHPSVTGVMTQGRLRNLLMHYGHKLSPMGAGDYIIDRHQLVRSYSDFKSVPSLIYESDMAASEFDHLLTDILRCSWEWSFQWKVLRDRELAANRDMRAPMKRVQRI